MDINLDIDIVCNECGKTLAATQCSPGELAVEPCEYCMDAAYTKGVEEEKV